MLTTGRAAGRSLQPVVAVHTYGGDTDAAAGGTRCSCARAGTLTLSGTSLRPASGGSEGSSAGGRGAHTHHHHAGSQQERPTTPDGLGPPGSLVGSLLVPARGSLMATTHTRPDSAGGFTTNTAFITARFVAGKGGVPATKPKLIAADVARASSARLMGTALPGAAGSRLIGGRWCAVPSVVGGGTADGCETLVVATDYYGPVAGGRLHAYYGRSHGLRAGAFAAGAIVDDCDYVKVQANMTGIDTLKGRPGADLHTEVIQASDPAALADVACHMYATTGGALLAPGVTNTMRRTHRLVPPDA
ncbi:hypothetical protein FOA52_015274 [Chlamydomonas sp. UWO 241]|nr:hypothetical protein FOA52_015274 [Chlamydomonas sp. UWO 241]